VTQCGAKIALWFAKTSAETKNGTVLGKVVLSTNLASTQLENFGGEESVCACSGHIYYLRMGTVDPN